MKSFKKVVDFKLGKGEPEMLLEGLAVIKQWKENVVMTDEPLTQLLQLAEMRIKEVLTRKHGTGWDD